MGLLDNLDLNDPKTIGLLNMGLGILAGNTGRPGDLGQGLMGGMQNYQQMMQAQQMAALRKQQQDMQSQQFDWTKQDRARQQKEEESRSGLMGEVAQQYGIDPNVLSAYPGIGEDLVKNKLIPKAPKIGFAPNGMAYDENNPTIQPGQVFAKPESGPAGIQEYEYARSQGYRGSFLDFQLAQKRAGASNTTVSYGAPVAGIDASGSPVFFQPDKTGGAPAIVPGVKPRPGPEERPTEGESKAAFYAQNMKAASKTRDKREESGFDPTSTQAQIGTAMAGGMTNPLASPLAQRARQAQNQWAEQMLRMQTGAAATTDEIKRTVSTYFPQVGDSSETVKQKKAMRAQAEGGVYDASGRAKGRVDANATATDLQSAAAAELARRRKGK